MSRAPTGAPEALSNAIDLAVRGETRKLYDVLTRGSNLPGPRANEALADAFADQCKSRGAAADRVALGLVALDADAAPGATELEFLPMCGVTAVAARAASDDAAYPKMLAVLHESADDLRYRVREGVIRGLVRIGERRGDVLVGDVASWMDGLFHAAAVLTAVAKTEWLSQIHAVGPVLERLDAAFALARDATRAAFRYPGHKALVEILAVAPGAVASRFGVPVFDMLVGWSVVKEPVLRDAIRASVGGTRLASRYAEDVVRVKAALEKSETTRRDPRTDVGPMRGRGKKRGRR